MKKWGIRKKVVSAKVDEGVFEALKKVSKEKDITISSLVNEILKKVLKEKIEEIKKEEKEKKDDFLNWLDNLLG